MNGDKQSITNVKWYQSQKLLKEKDIEFSAMRIQCIFRGYSVWKDLSNIYKNRLLEYIEKPESELI